MKKVAHNIGNVLYTLVVLLVLGFALLFLGTKIDMFGYEVKVVQSGSMEPAIQTGGIVIIAPAEHYQVGDIITFGPDTRESVPVTHRIVEKTGEGADASYHTKGDANEEADGRTIAHADIIGAVAFSMPYVGYVLEFARTPLGFGLLVGVPALLIVLDELANIAFEIHKYRYRMRKQKSGAQKQKGGTRAGPTGYRTPSRERGPRDFPHGSQAKKPQLVPSTPQAAKRSPRSYVLDLRHYTHKRHSV